MQVKPDYSSAKRVADVYLEYVVGWLEEQRGKKAIGDWCPLIFLSKAGIGLFGSTKDLPTWVPNFPKQSGGDISSMRVGHGGPAARKVFGDKGEKYPYVMAPAMSLCVWGVKIQTIGFVSEAPQLTSWHNGKMLDFIRGFMSRRAEYVSGMSCLQAFFNLIHRKILPEVSPLQIFRALAFLKFLVNPYYFQEPSLWPDTMREMLRLLGFDLISEDFEKHFVRNFFPGTDIGQFGLQGALLTYSEQALEGPLAEVWDRVVGQFLTIHQSWRFIETTDGYLGLAPVGTEPGDVLCVLNGCDVPVVLRKVLDENYYTFVGTTFVVGLMNGEAIEFINKGITEPQWFELR